MLTQTGCLLGETPEYQSRRQTPPVILSEFTSPSPNRVLNGRVGETPTFTLKFRSEDAGERMSFSLIRNFQSEGVAVLGSSSTGPSSNLYKTEGDPTQVSLEYTFRASDVGCNSYTMLVTHKGNIDFLDIDDPEDVGSVTWWALVVGVNGESGDVLVGDCGGAQ
ncbi:MAG: hypothetical protein R3B07_22620 [Polyangiaceae bacterium]